MITVEESIVIERPLEDVFAYVSDQTNAPRWQPGLLEVRRTTDGPIGVGTRHSVVRKLGGRTVTLSNEYTRYEPDKLVEFSFWGSMPGRASYVVDPVGPDRTKVTGRVEMRLPGLLRVAEPLMALAVRRDMLAGAETLKGLLETNAGEGATDHLTGPTTVARG